MITISTSARLYGEPDSLACRSISWNSSSSRTNAGSASTAASSWSNVSRSSTPPTSRGGGARARRRAALGDHLADHAQRQELVPLHAQDGAQLIDVLLAVEPVPAGSAPGRDQALVLEEPDLRDGDVRELLLERLAHRPDRQPGGAASASLGRLGGHLVLRPGGRVMDGRAKIDHGEDA